MLIISRGVGALTVILVLVVATPQGRTAVETALFIPQIIPTIPVKPQEWVSSAPIRQEVEFPIQDGTGVADLYSQPGDEKRGSVLLFLGVNPAGRDDPRVVGLANGLARTGVAVMIPWSDTMTDQRVDVSEVDNLVRAFEFLIAQESVDPDRSGMGGFCVGASLATVAAQDERIRSKVKFVNFFGGYYDARDLVTSVVSHSRFHGDVVEPWQPDVLSKRVVTTHLIEGLSNAEEQALLTRVFVTKDAALGDAGHRGALTRSKSGEPALTGRPSRRSQDSSRPAPGFGYRDPARDLSNLQNRRPRSQGADHARSAGPARPIRRVAPSRGGPRQPWRRQSHGVLPVSAPRPNAAGQPAGVREGAVQAVHAHVQGAAGVGLTIRVGAPVGDCYKLGAGSRLFTAVQQSGRDSTLPDPRGN